MKYYHQLARLHILGRPNSTDALLELSDYAADYTRVPLAKAQQVADLIGTDLKTLVLTYGLGREVISIADLENQTTPTI